MTARPRPYRLRPGTTLVELILFFVVLGIIGFAMLPLFFNATESRLLQQTMSVVEQNGTQLLQSVSFRIHGAERILDPLPGSTGAVLTLQTASGAANPTIIGLSSGSLVIIRHATRQVLSSPQVAIDRLVVRNTSTSSTRQSAQISFRVSRTIRLHAPHTYSQPFEATFTLLPADAPTGNTCGCAMPSCAGGNVYTWQVCQEGSCFNASAALDCP